MCPYFATLRLDVNNLRLQLNLMNGKEICLNDDYHTSREVFMMWKTG